MLNKVFIIGRLTREPDIRFLPSGMQITSFTIANNRRYKDRDGNWKEDSYFFDIETFGALAERVGRQLEKGTQILIEGSLRQDKWENSAGEKRSRIKIVADRISILSKVAKKEESSSMEESVEEPIEDFSSDDDVPL
ncbi:single-stranded DNA-binding protein [Venenivibrio stagnispumantis]|uniref:Single-stranded DNA-binding protein n=1 Tax=Venenivibrio stagnispumantis TaxID=407998 RepID=A0AA45WN33_9AQUI|nr:single-stranded DNA-binding protein [Venenivibrio stagnispumantis]MCW4573593.1 single-stranded DNA-binding protein [Venenivibrio stagnispumantis]SMP16866.1 single-strand binding protein [Venenivibrio stagnispumantis]